MGRSFAGGTSTDNLTPVGFQTHNNTRTYTAWFILNDVDSFRRILDKEDGSGSTLVSLWWHASQDRFYFQHRFSGGLGEWVSPRTTAEADGNWHHIAVTYDASSSTNDPVFYLDGVSTTVADGGAHAPSGTSSTAATNWMIGNRPSLNRCWNGSLAHVAIWDRILNGTEVLGLAGGDNPLSLPTSLAVYWPIDGTSSPEPDSGTSGFDATVTGTSASGTNPTVDPPPGNGIDLTTLDGSAIFHNGSVTVPGRVVTFSGENTLVDGVKLNLGSPAEGLPTNIRMVNATVDFSVNVSGWDSEANTNNLIAQLSNYASYGLNAITVNFQGGLPQPISGITWATDGGYDAGAFNADGSMRPAHTARMAKLINAILANNMIPIVGLFYFRQDDIFTNQAAIENAVDNAAAFLAPWKNQILVEIANEVDSANWDHTILTDTDITGVENLVTRMKAFGFLVSISFSGGVNPPTAIAGGCDFILLHGNDRTAAQITTDSQAAIARYPGIPVFYNEDGPTNRTYSAGELDAHFDAAVAEGVGWGAYLQVEYQTATSPTINWVVRTGDSQDVFNRVTHHTTAATANLDLNTLNGSATFNSGQLDSIINFTSNDLSATFPDQTLLGTGTLDLGLVNLSATFNGPNLDGFLFLNLLNGLATFNSGGLSGVIEGPINNLGATFNDASIGQISIDLNTSGSSIFHNMDLNLGIDLDLYNFSALFNNLIVGGLSVDLDSFNTSVFPISSVRDPLDTSYGIYLPLKGSAI